MLIEGIEEEVPYLVMDGETSGPGDEEASDIVANPDRSSTTQRAADWLLVYRRAAAGGADEV